MLGIENLVASGSSSATSTSAEPEDVRQVFGRLEREHRQRQAGLAPGDLGEVIGRLALGDDDHARRERPSSSVVRSRSTSSRGLCLRPIVPA